VYTMWNMFTYVVI